jgi:hypothetical protein
MANVKITDLTEDTTPADGDWVETVDISAGASKKVTRTNFFLNPPLGAASVDSEALNATIACRAYLNGAQNTTSGATTKVLLDTENYDTGSDFDTDNSRFVAPKTGYYQVNASIRYNDLADGSESRVLIYVNGAVYSGSVTYLGVTNGDPSSSLSDLVYITAGQYIELYAVQNSGTEALTTGTANNFMTVHFVGA